MNSRNYDHVPPLASNTVTVATSSTTQARVPPGTSQMRSMPTVPMRQPVPIRKIVHDSGGGGMATTSGGIPPVQYPIVPHQVKEEVDTMDYPGASTSSGPLIGPSSSTSNSFQQYQRGSTGTQSSSSTVTSGALVMNNGNASSGSSMAMDQPAPVNLASKVAEVFLTAGHAFQKLGDLTLQLHTTADADESKWSEKEVDNLKVALTRFAHELDQISTCVASRTTKHIKNDIKRRHLVADDPPQPTKRLTMNSGGGQSGTYTTVNSVGMMSGHPGSLGQKRMGGPSMGKLMTARAVIPTTRYTVAPLSGGGNSSGMIPSSTVVVNSSQSPSPVGMPQLQSQSGPSSSSAGSSSQQQQRIVTTNVASTTITRVMAPQQMLQGGLKSNVGGGGGGMPLKRVMTPTSSGAMSMPSSGALILEHGDHPN